MSEILHEPRSYHAHIGAGGRITIPAELRSRVGLRVGSEVVLAPHGKGIEIRSYEQAVKRAQDLFCGAAPAARVLSEELMAERRRDAALDD